jgi:hypothetical protein
LVSALGLVLHAIVYSVNIQDRDGGIPLLATVFRMYPFLKKLVPTPASGAAILEGTRQNPALPRNGNRQTFRSG